MSLAPILAGLLYVIISSYSACFVSPKKRLLITQYFKETFPRLYTRYSISLAHIQYTVCMCFEFQLKLKAALTILIFYGEVQTEVTTFISA